MCWLKVLLCAQAFSSAPLHHQSNTRATGQNIADLYIEEKTRSQVTEIEMKEQTESKAKPCWSEESRKRTVWFLQARRHWCHPRHTHLCDDNDLSGLAGGEGDRTREIKYMSCKWNRKCVCLTGTDKNIIFHPINPIWMLLFCIIEA